MRSSDTPNGIKRRKRKLRYGFECSRCDKLLSSPEAGNAHLDRRHNGEGFLVWRQERKYA